MPCSDSSGGLCSEAMEVLCSEGSNSSLCGDVTQPEEIMLDFDYREPYQNAIGAVFILIIMILSILGNLAVILAVVRTQRLREELSSILLINLSLTDLLSATFVMPYTFIALLADGWLLGDKWCTAQCALNYCCIIVSMLTLSMISIDRHVAIVYPLRYSGIVTPLLIYAMSGYTWVQGFAFALVPIICKWVVYDYWEIVCAIDWDSYRDHGGLTYVIVAFVLCFMVPAIVMTISYIRIYRAAKGHYRRRSGQQQMRKNPQQQKQETKIIISLAVVVVMFFICTTPFCVTKVIKIFFSTDVVPVWLNFVATYAQYIASATNPFIYGIFRSDFRKAFSRLICSSRILPLSNNNDSNNSSMRRNSSLKYGNSVVGRKDSKAQLTRQPTERFTLTASQGSDQSGHNQTPVSVA